MQAMHDGGRRVCARCPRHRGSACLSAHLANAPILQYNWPPMNEFDLQGWEREIQAWRRRLDSQELAAPQTNVVRAELDDIQRDSASCAASARPRRRRAIASSAGWYSCSRCTTLCRGRVGKA